MKAFLIVYRNANTTEGSTTVLMVDEDQARALDQALVRDRANFGGLMSVREVPFSAPIAGYTVAEEGDGLWRWIVRHEGRHVGSASTKGGGEDFARHHAAAVANGAAPAR
jgi:hypothetical protein